MFVRHLLASSTSVKPQSEKDFTTFNVPDNVIKEKVSVSTKKAEKPDWGCAMYEMSKGSEEIIISIQNPDIHEDRYEDFQIVFTDGVHLGSLFCSKKQMKQINRMKSPYYKVKLCPEDAFYSNSGQKVLPGRIVEILGK